MRVFVSVPRNKIVFKTFVTEEVREYLQERFTVEYSSSEHELTAEEFKERVRDCDAVITGWGHTKITYDMLKDSCVKVIAHTGGSIGDFVDMSVFDNGIMVLSGNTIYAESVAEGTIAYMLLGLRRLPYYVNEVRNGGWHGNGFFNEGLFDQTVGIVGFGTISHYVIELLRVFRAKIKIYSSHEIDVKYLEEHHAQQVPLNDIVATCKIVSIHSSLTPKTFGMIGKEQFDLLQKGALFINTARGGLIREQELIDSLRNNCFSAVLDVFCLEPLPLDSPLRIMQNVYCVPHMGGPTVDRRAYVTKRLADALLDIEHGEKSVLEVSRSAASRMTVHLVQ